MTVREFRAMIEAGEFDPARDLHADIGEVVAGLKARPRSADDERILLHTTGDGVARHRPSPGASTRKRSSRVWGSRCRRRSPSRRSARRIELHGLDRQRYCSSAQPDGVPAMALTLTPGTLIVASAYPDPPFDIKDGSAGRLRHRADASDLPRSSA